MESLEAYLCDGIEPYSGDYYFIVGALCNTASYSEAYQEIDLSAYIDCIDQELAYADYGGYLSDWGGDDHPEMTLAFIDEMEMKLIELTLLAPIMPFGHYFQVIIRFLLERDLYK